jgi:lipopolysaccharide transport system ATP-binding protein
VNGQPAGDTRKFIWALRDVSFEVNKGEIVGVIGRNGSGKSTLLKILARITEPTEGRAEIHGRVGSLLEVGTGFHPELTGRENIYLNGSILGMRRAEIDRKFDEIVAFAEVERFLNTPVKRYSSGMYVRLAFAVAAHLDPEILLVDEVLAVGDAAFQKKCLGNMGEAAKGGRTVIFVSHNMGAVAKLCPRSIWLDSGKVRDCGDSSRIIESYLETSTWTAASVRLPRRPGAKAQITGVRLLDGRGRETSTFRSGEEPTVELDFVFGEKTTGCHVACILTAQDGTHLFSTADTDTAPERFGERPPGQYLARVKLPTRQLNVGTYHLAVGLGIPGVESFDRREALTFSIRDSRDFGTGKETGRRAGLLLVEAPWEYLSGPARDGSHG